MVLIFTYCTHPLPHVFFVAHPWIEKRQRAANFIVRKNRQRCVELYITGLFFNIIFLRFLMNYFEKAYRVNCSQQFFNCHVYIQITNGTFTKLHNFQMFRITLSGVTGILVETLSDFSSQFCKNRFFCCLPFDKNHFLPHLERMIKKFQSTYSENV